MEVFNPNSELQVWTEICSPVGARSIKHGSISRKIQAAGLIFTTSRFTEGISCMWRYQLHEALLINLSDDTETQMEMIRENILCSG